MSDEKHTPGPWRLEWDGSEGVIIGRPTWPCDLHGIEGEWQIAVTDDLRADKSDEAEANALLITAAPELLAALKAVVAISDRKHAAWDAAKAAIAKAEGSP